MRLRFSDRSHWDCRPVSLFGNASAVALGEELGMSMDRRRFRANFYADWDGGRPSARTNWSAERWQWATGSGSRFSSATRAAR